jgi:hypothetical protein
MAYEYDVWKSHSSQKFLGVFSTYNKAKKALKTIYGNIDTNGSSNDFYPKDESKDVVLSIESIILNDF